MKIAYFGTWDFSKNILSGIIKNKDIDIKLVVSQADKPVWRKKEIIATPVKALALENKIKVMQPEKLKDNKEFFEELKWLDFIVVVAYGKIVPKEVLEAPKYWCINLHWSILPKYRWASPIQESIKNWDTETWLTIMYMSEGMDEWDILDIQKTEISLKDKTPDIFKKFEDFGVKLLIKTLKKVKSSEIKWIKQKKSEATYCSKISKQDWEISFKLESAKKIYDKFRAYYPWPGIYSFYKWKKFSIEDCYFDEEDKVFDDEEFSFWDVIETEKGVEKNIWIICKKWILIIKKVKLEWKKSMDILSFINWNKDFLEYTFEK